MKRETEEQPEVPETGFTGFAGLSSTSPGPSGLGGLPSTAPGSSNLDRASFRARLGLKEETETGTQFSGFGALSTTTPSQSKPSLGDSYVQVGSGTIKDPQTSEALKSSATRLSNLNISGGLQEGVNTPEARNIPSSRNLFGTGSGTYSDTKTSFKPTVTFNLQQSPPKEKQDEDVKPQVKSELQESSETSSDLENVLGGGLGQKEPKYKLFCIPTSGITNDYCLKYKGTGPNFCLMTNCQRNHTGNGSFRPKPNVGYVLKNPSAKMLTAVDTPEIELSRLGEEFRHEVMTEAKTLKEWTRLSVNSKTYSQIGFPFTKTDFTISKNTAKKYKNLQSPLVSKVKREEARSKLAEVQVPNFEDRQFDDISGMPPNAMPELVEDIEKNLTSIRDFLEEFYEFFKDDHSELEELAQSVSIKYEEVLSSVGAKPTIADPDLDVPNLWTGYTTLIQMVKSYASGVQNLLGEKIKKSEEKLKFNLQQSINLVDEKISRLQSEGVRINTLEKKMDLVDLMENDIKTTLLPKIANLENLGNDIHTVLLPAVTRIDGQVLELNQQALVQKSFSSQAVKHITNHNSRIETVEKELYNVKNSYVSQAASGSHFSWQPPSQQHFYGPPLPAQYSGAPSWTGGFSSLSGMGSGYTSSPASHDLATRMAKLEGMMNAVTEDKKSKIIKFANLNLRSVKDCEAWLDQHHPGNDFGMLIDFHAAMEHITQQLSGTELLKHMHETFRLQIRDLNQAYMVQSYERKIPKFMHAEAKHKSISIKESHLGSLSSWDAWDKPEDGLKAILEKELSSFTTAFRSTLTEQLAYDFPLMYSVCTQALSASENFIITMIAFVEEMFKLYSNAHYSPEHAWHIVTMLLKAIILKIVEPRVGVALRFEKTDMKKVKALTFFSCLQCIDIMEELRAVKLKNDTDAAMDLIRFVSRNPESYKMVNLDAKVVALEASNKELKRKFDELSKKLVDLKTGGDEKLKQKVNDLNSQVTNQNKRIKVLEKKAGII